MQSINLSGISLEQIKLFMLAVETESITKAGSQLFLTQPSASKKIAAFENAIGVELFTRSQSKIIPTAAAKRLYDRLYTAYPEFESAFQEALSVQSSGIKSLRVGVHDPVAVRNLIPAVYKFRSTHQMVQIRLETFDMAELRNKLLTGELDVIITMMFELSMFPGNFAARNFSLGNSTIYMSEQHRLAKKENVTIEDLDNERFIIHSPSVVPYHAKMVSDICAEHGIQMKIGRIVDHPISFLPSLLLNEGVLIACHSYRVAASDGVVSFPIEGTVSGHSLIWNENTATDMLHDFVRIVAELADETGE